MKDAVKLTGLCTAKKESMHHFEDTFFLNPPLSDLEILKFQDVLMTPSIHHIVTKNIQTGRSLMNRFLLALRYFHNVGCLTLDESQELLSHVFNLSKIQKTNISFIDSIELFCIENPHLNFVWIELTQALQKQISKKEIRKIAEIFSSDAQTPVIIMSYQEEILRS